MADGNATQAVNLNVAVIINRHRALLRRSVGRGDVGALNNSGMKLRRNEMKAASERRHRQ